MIEIITRKDLEWFGTKLQEVMERTKRQTKQIQELKKEVKELNNEFKRYKR